MIVQGDNRETLKTLEDNSIDAIVTDPPYGIDFLGKAWDANTGALETYQECLRVLKPGGYILAFSAARTYHHLAVTLEQAGFEIRDQIMWLYSSGFPKAQDIGKAIDKRAGKEHKSTAYDQKEPITPTRFMKSVACQVCGTKSKNPKGTGFYCGHSQKVDLEHTEAKQWEGWKTALKPAHEPICMARKPFKGSCIDNVLEHGVGALNIDAARIPWPGETPKLSKRGAYEDTTELTDGMAGMLKSEQTPQANEQGRFPSNVIGAVEGYQKYFYCPKVSRKERHIGFDTSTIPTDSSGKFDRTEEQKLNANERIENLSGNNHPTVKPVELMKYLIQLVTPPNSTVLDPFCGSGSTGMAAVELGHDFIGCELDPNYVDIAKARIAAWNTDGTTKKEFFE